MRKKSFLISLILIFSLFCMPLLSFSNIVYADELTENTDKINLLNGYDPLIDAADLLTDSEEEDLYRRIMDIYELYDFDVTILTINNLPYYSSSTETFCDSYEEIDISRDGIVFTINMDADNYGYDRGYSSSPRNSGLAAFNNAAFTRINDDVVPLLTSGDYFDAFNTYLDLTSDFLEAYQSGKPYSNPIPTSDFILWVILAPLAGALIISGLIVYGALAAQMKTAVIQTEAKEFMKQDSLNLTIKTDTFIRESETRRYDPPKSSSSSGGGGGGSSRSGSF